MSPRGLYEVILDRPREPPGLPTGATLVASCGQAPLWFINAPEDSIEQLRSIAGVIDVRSTEEFVMNLAIGVDRVLSFTAEHAGAPKPNGWAERVDHDNPDLIPRRPVLQFEPPLVVYDDVIEPTFPFRLSVVVISKEPEDFSNVGPTDPVAIATFAASAFGSAVADNTDEQVEAALSQRGPVILFAAGNHGPGALSVWASFDWALGVGATLDREGSTLAPYSATGTESSPGPDLVAWGASALDETRIGTSFAAPNAARQVATLWAFAETVVYAASQYADGQVQGIPVSAIGIIDSGTIPIGPCPLPRYPDAGIDTKAIAQACALLAKHGHTISPKVQGSAVRHLLLKSARPPPSGATGWGSGFVSDITSEEFCKRATAADMLDVLLPDGSALSPALLRQLASIALADTAHIVDACQIWRQALALIHVHEETGAVTLA